MKTAPIAFFCFNRPDKTKEVLEALSKNHLAKESELFIFCDGPRNIKDLPQLKEVHKVIDAVEGFKKVTVVKREINHGVRESIVQGINSVLENSESIVVVEDDILTSAGFLTFINQSLQFYESQENVWCITGFNYPEGVVQFPKTFADDVFFVKGKNSAWGWGTWRKKWQKIDFDLKDFDEFSQNKGAVKKLREIGENLPDLMRLQKTGKINTWDIQFTYAMFKNDAYTVHSSKTLVKNIGFDGDGIHTHSDKKMTDFELEEKTKFNLKNIDQIPNNREAELAYLSYYKRNPFFVRWINSPKRRRNLRWIIIGFLISELLHLAFN